MILYSRKKVAFTRNYIKITAASAKPLDIKMLEMSSIYLFISTDAMATQHDNQSENTDKKQLPCNKWWTTKPNKKHLLLPI